MSQESQTRLQFGSPATASKQLSELVMAWATDAETGLARYIHELGPDRAGAKCGCICPACGSALTAVNVAKDTYIKRPHFRHPSGTGTDQCAVLSARVALLQNLAAQGWIDLPARRLEGRATGLSGQGYEHWVTRKPERVNIRDVQYLDRVTAMFTLADGRQIRVCLTGTVESFSNGDCTATTAACIYLDVDDDSLREMSPEDIRAQLKLLGDRFCWSSHWDDHVIQAEANTLAEFKAIEHLDAIPKGLELPADMPPALKRETVLHYVVKQLLEEAGEVWTPAHPIELQHHCNSGRTLIRDGILPAQQLTLKNVVLEKRVGKLRPDLFCEASEAGVQIYNPLFIEVTVTHGIDERRAQRLVEQGIPTLELDFSQLGGRVTQGQLKELVVREVENKRWVFNPLVEAMRAQLAQELERQRIEFDAEWEREQAEEAVLRDTPVQQFAAQYLEAVQEYLTLLTVAERNPVNKEQSQTVDSAATEKAIAAIRNLAGKLAKKGHPEASEEALFGWHGTLAKLLSIQHDRGIGYKVDSGFQVLNACFQANPVRREHAALCMAAAKIFELPLREQQQEKMKEWRQEILASVVRGEKTYGRKHRHDSILALLFPSLRESIEKTRLEVMRTRIQRRATAEAKPEFLGPKIGTTHNRFPDGSGYWLTGKDLDQWIKKNPSSAAHLGYVGSKRSTDE